MTLRTALGLFCLLPALLPQMARAAAVAPPEPFGPVPNARQVEWYQREIIAFFHFGINTFGDNVNEGDGKAPAALFNPTAFDCRQWMRVLKDAGIPCGILVAKHADGFCKPSYGTPAYVDYYAGQLHELMRNYGPVWETWWDGAGADFLTTDFYTRWAAIIRTKQPNCVIFGTKNSHPFADCRWVGNESGFAGDPCWSTIDPVSIRDESAHINELNHGELDGTAYIPAEVDVSIRPSWFYHAEEDGRVKSVEELVKIYC
jgi:alpha-L-fucosidase